MTWLLFCGFLTSQNYKITGRSLEELFLEPCLFMPVEVSFFVHCMCNGSVFNVLNQTETCRKLLIL